MDSTATRLGVQVTDPEFAWELLRRRGLSLRTIARAASLSHQFVSMVMSRQRSASVQSARALAAAIDVHPSVLFEFTDGEPWDDVA